MFSAQLLHLSTFPSHYYLLLPGGSVGGRERVPLGAALSVMHKVCAVQKADRSGRPGYIKAEVGRPGMCVGRADNVMGKLACDFMVIYSSQLLLFPFIKKALFCGRPQK